MTECGRDTRVGSLQDARLLAEQDVKSFVDVVQVPCFQLWRSHFFRAESRKKRSYFPVQK